MTTTKKSTKKPKQLTLFFESKEACARACEKLGLSLRKVADIDRTHSGNYSKVTNHYGTRFRKGNTMRVNIRSKLIIDEDIYHALSQQERIELDYLDVTSVSWIAP